MEPQHPDRQVKGLLSLARDRSATTRETLLVIAQDLFNGRDRVLTQSERILMHDMARSLVDRAEATVRSQLASYLGSLPDAPHTVVAYLSTMSRSIAYSILADSGVLADSELVEALYHKGLQQQLTLARVQGLPTDIDDLLAEALGQEPGQAPKPASDRYFFRPIGATESPALDPADLTAGLVRRLCLWCSVALRQHLLEYQKIDEIVLDDGLEYAVDEAARSLGGRTEPTETPAKIAPPAPDTPATLVQLLEDGNISDFEAALARMSQLRANLIRRMMYETGGEALATICVATEVPRRAFAAIYLLTREPESTGAQQVAGALAFYDRLNPVAARRVVARWRRDAEYLNAIREVGGA